MNNASNLKLGISFAVCASVAFGIMVTFVHSIAQQTPNNVIVLFRFIISFLYILVILGLRVYRKQPINLSLKKYPLQIIRSIAGMLAMLLLYLALAYVPLVDATLLSTTYPLFLPLIILIVLRKTINIRVWVSLTISFIGITLILEPGYEIFNPAALFALISGLLAAISIFIVRMLSKENDVYSIMFHYFLIALIISSLISVFHWQLPSPHILLVLCAIGVFGTIYQELTIRALACSPATLVSSLMYLNVVFSGFFGWLFWHEMPNLLDIIGIILVCCGAMLTIIFFRFEY
ncbi:MAG: hypothetical protein AMJ43_04010 [Coxiella sp. DG_40]|nr:MAG: hypothetical protein AMJ43_04010 [Coxiella sp. DG_40]